MYCPYCGAENSDGSVYCMECGMQMPSATKQNEQVVLPKEQRVENKAIVATVKLKRLPFVGRAKEKMVICGIVSVICVVLIAVGYSANDSYTEKYTVESNYAYIAVCVYNDEDASLDITVTAGDTTIISSATTYAGYYIYTNNFSILYFDGFSEQITVTATGVSSSGNTYSDSETLTVQQGQQYRIVLYL